MAKNARPLATTYGKLRVLSERTEFGRRIVTTRCRCGVLKEVFADALLAGRTRSCGDYKCRQYRKEVTLRDPGFRPTGTRVISIDQLHKYWKLHRDEKWTAHRIAEEFGENRNTLYAAFRSIRRVGGWANYHRGVTV